MIWPWTRFNMKSSWILIALESDDDESSDSSDDQQPAIFQEGKLYIQISAFFKATLLVMIRSAILALY